MSEHDRATDPRSVWPAQPLVTPWDGMKLTRAESSIEGYPSAATVTWAAAVPAPRQALDVTAEEPATSV